MKRHPNASFTRVVLRTLEKVLLGGVLGTYLIISRTIAVVGALYLVLYFFVGTSSFMNAVREVIAEHMPGVVSAASVQWGPAPWELRVADGRIFGENGQQVVQVDAAIGDIDILPTLAGLFRLVTEPEAPVSIHFNRVRLGHPKAFVHMDELGRVDLHRAFTRPEDPLEEGPPLTFDITSRTVDVINGSGTVDGPGYHLDVTGLDATSNFALTGEDHAAFFIPRAHVARADNWLTSEAHAGLALEGVRIPLTDLRVESFLWDGYTFSWQRARAHLPNGHLDAAGGWDIEPDLSTWYGTVRVQLDRGAPALADFGGDALDGDLDATLSGRGNTEQIDARLIVRAAAMEVAGLPLRDLRLGARFLPRAVPSDPEAHTVELDWLAFDAWGGHVALHDGLYGPRPGIDDPRRDDDFAASIRLDGVRTDAFLADLWPLLPPDATSGASLTPVARLAELADLRATLHGGLVVSGTRSSREDTTDARLLLDDVQIAWDGVAPPLPGDYVVGGTVRLRSAPIGGGGDPDSLTPVRRIDLERVAVDGRNDRLRLEGSLDLASGDLDLTPYVRLGEIRDDARRLGLGDLEGRFVLKQAHIGGTLAAPRIRAVASWSNARAAGHALGHVTAQLGLNGDHLDVTAAHTASSLGEVDLDGQLTLFDGAFGVPNRALPFRITRLDARRIALGLIAPELGIDAPIDVTRTRVSGQLTNLLGTLTGQGALAASGLELGGEPLRELSLRFDADAKRIDFDDLVIVGRGGERITGKLGLTRKGQRLHGTLRARDLPLDAVRAIRRAAPEVRGAIGANLTVGGTLDRPSLIGRVALAGIRWGAVDLGDAELDIQTLPSGRVDVSSASFFPGFELVDGSGADMDGLVPTHVHLAVRGAGANLGDLLPATRKSGVLLSTRASASLDLWPGRVGKAWDLRIDAGPGEIELGMRDQNLRWTNATPLALVVEQERTRLSPVAFTTIPHGRGPRGLVGADPTRDETLSICGTLEQRGALDLELAGVADLGILRALKDAFSVFEGKVAIAAAPAVAAALGDARCLPGDDDAVLHVTGDLAAPILAGRLEPIGVSLVPRDFGRELRLADGRGVDLVPGEAPGVQHVRSSADHGLVVEVDDGTLGVSGDLVLDALTLDHAAVDIVGTDVFYSRPGEFTATFNPSLQLTARALEAEVPSLALTGQVLVTDGHFTRSFDTFAQAIGTAIGGDSAAYSRPLGEAAPWLANMALDIDMKSSDFQIDSAFPLGQANMEARLDLTIGGTVEAPRVYRRIDLVPGGNLTYRVFRRDFEIRSGFVDFDGDAEHPTIDVTAQTEVTYLARASSDTQDEDEKEVLIALRIHGRVPDLKIDMSSDDSTFDQDDLQSLVLTGRPRRELDRSTGTAVFTTDLAAVLNDVLKAPFIRTAAVGLSPGGDLRADVGTCFGRDLCFTTTAVQETTETTLRARFRLHLGDDLTCDGTLRRSDTAVTTTATQEKYEARCRYRIPLD
ncbi:MAG: hypothetical protein EP329_20895 [Deltaproteobacteria bacterium]|nr:MAG: hypothetical protein EP329_20895 [Deltaproteobacteria bacterium]